MRLIDADELKKALAEMWYENNIRITGLSVAELIDDAPTIESLSAEEEEENGTFVNRDNWNFNCNDSNRALVEVVRCKDCRYAEHREQMPNQVYCKRDKLSAFCSPHDDDDFCKYGERKKE